MSFNGIIGANCINRTMIKALLDSLPEDYNDVQAGVLLDTLEKLPDCSKIMDDGGKPLEPGKRLAENGELVEIPKKERKLSKYNLFVRQCMQNKNHDFKSCAGLWHEEKIKSSLQG